MQDVAVLYLITLAFGAQLAGVAGAGFAAIGDEILVGDGFGADEAALEIGVDDAGCFRRLGAVVGGYQFDTTGGYGWLWSSSFALALLAAAIAALVPHRMRTALAA